MQPIWPLPPSRSTSLTDPAELASGAVFAMDQGRFARFQRVVATGVYLNEITSIDLTKPSFGADFWLWQRFARDAGPGAADPTDNMVAGRFDRARPSETKEAPDGTVYRLWLVQGEFRDDFDLHRFPFDRQTLTLPFFNARAAADRVVYVLDQRAVPVGRVALSPSPRPGAIATAAASVPAPPAPGAIADAFRDLAQWRPLGAEERRDNLVTPSALGDPRWAGAESFRELSGFLVAINLSRRALATLSKSPLPLLLMTLIMFASLYFPAALMREKITVAITGAVLLASVNGQLGGTGYTIAMEYAFYLFFGLCQMCVISVLLAERSRVAKRNHAALAIESWTRLAFLLLVAGALAGALALNWSGG
jgi:branched-chain amino acid transport system substrate-binding protein